MLYQKLLMGSKPYFIMMGSGSAFEIHRHPEIELSLCTNGSYEIICESRRYSLSEGDFIIVPPMASHEIPQNKGECKQITIEVGYTLLGEFFKEFESENANCRVYKKEELAHTSQYVELVSLIEKTAELHYSDTLFKELSVKGNLYRISALLLQILHSTGDVSTDKKRKSSDIKKIDKALDTIYSRYYEPLSVEEISTLCGYSKSNFCKIFKSITGDTFHNTLNRHRVEIACILLRDNNYTVEKIAQETGFADTKSFCRVFKNIIGTTAGEYKKTR